MKYAARFIQTALIVIILSITLVIDLHAEEDIIEFDSPRWELYDAEITQHLGRNCLKGTGLLKDVEFADGIIEVDIAVDGHRAYPGVIFRMLSQDNYESFYIRPHRAGLYPDALQYTPVINGAAGWQLYNGKGYTAEAIIPANQWNHLKIEIQGSRARVYWNDETKSALEIYELKHWLKKGRIGVSRGPGDADVYFSNFRYCFEDKIEFETPPEMEIPEGMITKWELSKIVTAEDVDLKSLTYAAFDEIFRKDCQTAESEASGLVNIDNYVQRKEPKPYAVLAIKTFESKQQQQICLSFGYSDEVIVFFNTERLYYGMSAYQSRDRSFVGVVGLNDAVYLNVKKGRNELILVLKEYYGGWGFLARSDPPLTHLQKDEKPVSATSQDNAESTALHMNRKKTDAFLWYP